MGDAAAHRKLAGHLRAVLSLPAGSGAQPALSIPPLSPCSLSACGAAPLAPLPDDGHPPRHRRRASGSVVRMLRTLVANRCVDVEGRVLRVATRKAGEGDGNVVEARAVVLVDVYLPAAAWSGWQFPRSRTAAAAVFRHLRCASVPSLARCLVVVAGRLPPRSWSPDPGRRRICCLSPHGVHV
jgi:hypothetical protein